MTAARSAGADVVLARSRFTADMPALFQRYVRIPDYISISAACAEPLSAEAREGIERFNQGEYYPAHDFLESAWVADLYRAILQVGIAYHQIQNGNYRGAVKMLLRVRQWLDPLPDICRGVDVASLRNDVERVYAAVIDLGQARIAEFDQLQFGKIIISD